MINIRKNNRGFALIFSLVLTLFFAVFVDTYCVLVNSNTRFAQTTGDSLRAYYVANAGIAYAFNQLENGTTNLALTSPINYTVGPGLVGNYSVSISSVGSQPWPTVTIRSISSYGTATKTLTLVVQPRSVSRWGYMSNTENNPSLGNLWFITGMTTEGPVHTNGTFNMYGDPIFTGPVTQSGSAINYYHGGPPQDEPVFEGGFTSGVPQVNFASATNPVITNIKTSAQSSGGLSLSGNTTIQLESSGKIQVTNSTKFGNNNPHEISIPANGSIFVTGGTATVWGTLNGQLSIGCDSDILISDNILYHQDPRTNPASTDILGLVAQNNINVGATGPYNLEIDASLVALTGSFQVPGWSTFAKGNMVQFGGLVNNTSGCTGSFDPSTGRVVSGYNQIMAYDARLQGVLTPPGFVPAQDANGRVYYSKLSLSES